MAGFPPPRAADRELCSDSGRAVDDVLRPIAMTPVLVPDQERRPARIDIGRSSRGPTHASVRVGKAITVEIGPGASATGEKLASI